MLRLLVAADLRLHGDAIVQALTGHGHSVVANVATTAAAVRYAALMRPDVAVLDLPRHESVTLLAHLREAAPAVKAIVVGVDEVGDDVVGLAEAGAAAYLPRSGSLQELVLTVEHAARGEALCSPAVAGALMVRVGTRVEPLEGGGLTVRERQVARLLADGLSNKEIATRLCIELSTVKNHVHRILAKLEVHRRGEAVARLRFC